MQRIHARTSISISDLKKTPSSVINQSQGEPIVILNHNRPTAYLVPAAAVEAIKEREGEPSVKVSLDDL